MTLFFVMDRVYSSFTRLLSLMKLNPSEFVHASRVDVQTSDFFPDAIESCAENSCNAEIVKGSSIPVQVIVAPAAKKLPLPISIVFGYGIRLGSGPEEVLHDEAVRARVAAMMMVVFFIVQLC